MLPRGIWTCRKLSPQALWKNSMDDLWVDPGDLMWDALKNKTDMENKSWFAFRSKSSIHFDVMKLKLKRCFVPQNCVWLQHLWGGRHGLKYTQRKVLNNQHLPTSMHTPFHIQVAEPTPISVHHYNKLGYFILFIVLIKSVERENIDRIQEMPNKTLQDRNIALTN